VCPCERAGGRERGESAGERARASRGRAGDGRGRGGWQAEGGRCDGRGRGLPRHGPAPAPAPLASLDARLESRGAHTDADTREYDWLGRKEKRLQSGSAAVAPSELGPRGRWHHPGTSASAIRDSADVQVRVVRVVHGIRLRRRATVTPRPSPRPPASPSPGGAASTSESAALWFSESPGAGVDARRLRRRPVRRRRTGCRRRPRRPGRAARHRPPSRCLRRRRRLRGLTPPSSFIGPRLAPRRQVLARLSARTRPSLPVDAARRPLSAHPDL
jgi:hypothetical protein